MLIDFHTHAFPDALAPRALTALSANIQSAPLSDGTVEGLIRSLDEWGVDRAVVCNIATNPRQTENVNSFAIETAAKYGSRLSPLGSVHPLYENPEKEFRRLKEHGIPGLKIHPDYMGLTIDDPLFDPIFELAAAYGMFLITHAGFDVASPEKIHATPDAILRRLERSPKTTLVAAHYGGNTLWDEVEEKLIGKDVYIDASLGEFCHLSPEQAARMLSRHDSERILFGSDCPWATSAATLRYLDALPLPDERKEKLYWRNAARLLKR